MINTYPKFAIAATSRLSKTLFIVMFLALSVGFANRLFAQAPVISYPGPQSYKTVAAISPLSPTNTGGAVPAGFYAQVSTFAGTVPERSNGTVVNPTFGLPVATAVDPSGNVYVTANQSNVIYKITPAGAYSIFAGSEGFLSGSANGTGTAASFNAPFGIACDKAGNLYVADEGNNLIREISPAGVVTTLAGSGVAGSTNGTGTAASFNAPYGIAVDASGNVYVGDFGDYSVRKITPAGVVTTLAGSGVYGLTNGTGTAASFSWPAALATDKSGNIYVADVLTNLIRKITPAGVVTTLAGNPTSGSANGTGTAASFNGPFGVAVDALGFVYVADAGNNEIRKINPAGVVTTLAGSTVLGSADGTGAAAGFYNPYSVALNASGQLYVADTHNYIVRQINIFGYAISPALPADLSMDGTGTISGTPVFASAATNYTIAAYNASGSATASVKITIVGSQPIISYTAPAAYKVGTAISPLTPTNTGGAVPASGYGQTFTLAGGTRGSTNGTGTGASFNVPNSIVMDSNGNFYVADGGNNLIREITKAGVVTTFAGSGVAGAANGMGTAASFNQPGPMAIDPSGNIYVVETTNNDIREITPAGVVSTLTLNSNITQPSLIAADGNGNIYIKDVPTDALFKVTASGATSIVVSDISANYLAIDPAGNLYYGYQNQVFKLSPAGVQTNFASFGTASANFSDIIGLATDLFGNVYVLDAGTNTVSKINPAGVITLLAGSGIAGSTNGIGASASFNGPAAAVIDASANLIVTSQGDNSIRKIINTGYNINPALPPGLSINGSTGAITGTPTMASPATTYTITAYNTGGSGVTTAAITVNGAPVISYETPQTFTTGTAIIPLAPDNSGGPVPSGVYGQVAALAGSGSVGTANGTGIAASFTNLTGAISDAAGNAYVSDGTAIRKITATGVVTTFAGSGTPGSANGTGTAASFSALGFMAADASGNIYVVDGTLIRKITPAAVVTTVTFTYPASTAAGTFAAAPAGIALDAAGNIYLANNGASSKVILKITPAAIVSIFAGNGASGAVNGTGTEAGFVSPAGMVPDASGNLYVADATFLREISPSAVVSTFAGSSTVGSANGTGTAASFTNLSGLATDGAGNIYAADNNEIRKITPVAVVSTFAGTTASGSANGTGTAATFNGPQGLAIASTGTIYIADHNNYLVRKASLNGYTISPALPAGLVFTTTTGTITGTPSAVKAAANYTVTAYNNYGTGTATLSVTVSAPSTIQLPAISYTTPQTYSAGTAISALSPVNSGGAVPANLYAATTTLAGSQGTTPALNDPTGVATDAAGNTYVTDLQNQQVYKITPAGVVTTIAGSGEEGSLNGTGTAASFNSPYGIAVDVAGNIYVSDLNNQLIRKITPSGVVSTFAGSGNIGAANGTASAASFNYPEGIAVDVSGNVYVADNSNNLIRKITPAGVVSTLAGSGTQGATNGTGTAASFGYPSGVAVDASGNVYVADQTNQLIRKITPAGVVTTLAGSGMAGAVDGAGTAASFDYPTGITVDAAGNVYVADQDNNLIRKITPAGVVTTIAGTSGQSGQTNGVGTTATFNGPTGAATDNQGDLYVADNGNHLIRKLLLTGYSISPALPQSLVFDATGTISGTPTAASASTNYTVTAYNAAGSDTTSLNITIKPTPPPIISYQGPQTYTVGVAISPLSPTNTGGPVSANSFVVSTLAGGTQGSANGTGVAASFNSPGQSAIDQAGNLYVADQSNNLIRKITPAGIVTTFAGSGVAGSANGTGTAATFSFPTGLAFDASGNLYVSENVPDIRKITPTGVVTTLVTGTSTNNISFPTQLVVDAQGNVYEADDGSNDIVKITPAGVVSTYATGFNEAFGLAMDTAGNMYVTCDGNNEIIKVAPNGTQTVLAGNGTTGAVNGAGSSASFNNPNYLAVDAAGNVYVMDSGNNLIREISPAGVVSTFAGTGTAGATNGLISSASFNFPFSATFDAAGNMYVTDDGDEAIRKITKTGYSIAPVLPAGLTIDPTAGTISGTPTVASPAATYTITASGITGTGTATLNITVVAASLGLSNLTLSKGTLSPTFATATTTYTDVVTNSTASLTLTPTASISTSAITVNGTAVKSGSASGAIALAVGSNTVTVVVTSQDGNTSKTYTVTVIRPSTNAKLAGLTLSSGTLTPAFNTNTTSYTVPVVNAVSSITVTPNVAVAGATIKVNGVVVTSGTASASIPLIVGQNTITTVVTAQDGVTTDTYTVTVTRAASSNAGLANITLSKGTLSPTFATATLSYSNTVTNSTTSVTLTPTLSDATATVTVNGTAVVSGKASAAITLSVGSNNVSVAVTAQDGVTKQTYTVNVIRVSTNAKLSAFTISSGTLTPAFNTNTTSYTASVTNATASITVTPTVAVTGATVKVNGTVVASGSASGALALSVGANTITTIVTAQDGTTTDTYTLTVTRAAAGENIPDAAISVGVQNFEPLLADDGINVHQGLSPNGDGINDYLQIDNITNYPENNLKIMTRNGQLIYEAKGYDNATRVFDGHSNKTGQMQLPGTYFYELDYVVKGIVQHKTGYLVLKY